MRRIAITGGPCSGKDTVLNKSVMEWIKDWDLVPHVLPEIASLIIGTGFSPLELMRVNRSHYIEMQRVMLKTQIALSREVEDLAIMIKDKHTLVLFENRGIMDSKSYLKPDEFKDMIAKELAMSEIECRDNHYDAVFHLRTIADTKPDLYMQLFRNNPARYEDTPEKAILADNQTLHAWLGHPHLRIIPNTTLDLRIISMEEKLEVLRQELKHFLAIDRSLEIERKFKLNRFEVDIASFPVPFVRVSIEQIYLKECSFGSRIRCRTQDDSSIYYLTDKKNTEDAGVREEFEVRITREQYEELSKYADPDFETISKERIYFVYNNQSFELDVFNGPPNLKGMILLEIELSHKDQKWEFPAWLGQFTDVTDIKTFSNRELARIT